MKFKTEGVWATLHHGCVRGSKESDRELLD